MINVGKDAPVLEASCKTAFDLGPVHAYPDIFESATFSFRIQKFPRPHVAYSNRIHPSTRIRFAFVTRRPYCPGRPKKLCFTTLSLAPTVLIARLSDTCGRGLRPGSHVSGYFRIRNFFFPDTATVHTYPANSPANPEKKKSAPPRVEKNISATNPMTCGRVNPDIS